MSKSGATRTASLRRQSASPQGFPPAPLSSLVTFLSPPLAPRKSAADGPTLHPKGQGPGLAAAGPSNSRIRAPDDISHGSLQWRPSRTSPSLPRVCQLDHSLVTSHDPRMTAYMTNLCVRIRHNHTASLAECNTGDRGVLELHPQQNHGRSHQRR